MSRRSLVVFTAAIALVLAVSPAAAGRNFLDNGKFRSGLTGWTLPDTDCAAPSSTVEWWNDASTGGSFAIASGGAAWLNACGNEPRPEINQTLTLVNGNKYRISGTAREDGQVNTGLPYLGVRINDVPVPLVVGTRNADGWETFTADFTAGTDTVKVSFVGELDYDVAYVVDNLSLSPRR